MNLSVKILTIALLVLLYGCNETMTSRYVNFQEAEDANLFKRGWFPNVLPVNSGQIVETHSVDTNQVCAKAVIPADSSAKIIANLKLQKFSIFDSKLPNLPFSTDVCQFKLENISNNRTALAKTNEIVVLDGEAYKLYYWSF